MTTLAESSEPGGENKLKLRNCSLMLRAAVINGWVTGNITITEKVVFESEAQVTG